MNGGFVVWVGTLALLIFLSPGCSSKGNGDPEHQSERAHTEEESHEGHEHEGGEKEESHEGHGHGGGEEEPADHGDHEGELRVVLRKEAISGAGIEVAQAGPRAIRIGLDLPGEVVPNADRLAHVVPRFPGIAKEVKKALGDYVKQNEVLAIVESNESLSSYEVRSLLSGTVIEKHITLGEFVRDDHDVFVVADLSTVWVNITVYARDLDRVRKGQKVEISVVGGGPRATATIDYIGAALGEATRAATARAVLPNSSLAWRPGMFVTARVVLEEPTVPVAILDSAIQRIEGEETVFVQEEEGAFEGRHLSSGRSDGEWTEVLSGLSPGERYVSAGSFMLKSELMKSEAGHEH